MRVRRALAIAVGGVALIVGINVIVWVIESVMGPGVWMR